jgi:hypothetical protein
MTETGRKTLTDKSFIVSSDGRKNETQMGSESEFYAVLMSEFCIAGPVKIDA